MSEPARMVEVGGKEVTAREAVAECTIHMSPKACAALMAGTPKGDPLEAAKVAGLMAAKRTSELLPFCHPIAITGASVTLTPDPERPDRRGDGSAHGGRGRRPVAVRHGQAVRPSRRDH